MRTMMFVAAEKLPFALKLAGIALLALVVFLFVFGTVTPFVNLFVAAIVAMLKGVGVAALTASPLLLIKLGVL